MYIHTHTLKDSSILVNYWLPVPGLHTGLHIQTARLAEIAFQRESRISWCYQFRIVLDDNNVGIQLTILECLALIQLEVHLQLSSSLTHVRLHKARCRLLVETAARVHNACKGFLCLQHNIHRVGTALQIHFLYSLVTAFNFECIR